MSEKRDRKEEHENFSIMDESTGETVGVSLSYEPPVYEQTTHTTRTPPTQHEGSHSYTDDEALKEYNETFRDEDEKGEEQHVVVFSRQEQTTMQENIIGKVIVRKGKVIKYEIDRDLLWEQVLRIIYHRIQMSHGTACLLNLRTISKQLTRECNIKSIAAVEGEVIDLMSTKFGVKDIDSEKEPRGLKKLRGTAEFWGTVGSRTKHNRKRVARVYAVTDPQKILRYIEGVLDVKG